MRGILLLAVGLTVLATPALAQVDIGRPTAGWTYFHKAGADMAAHDAAVFDCIDQALRARIGVSASEMAFTHGELKESLARHGFDAERLEHRDFLHPATPPRLIPLMKWAQSIAEHLPGLRRISGSLWTAGAYRPRT